MRCIGTVAVASLLSAHVAAAQPPAADPPVGGRLAGALLLAEAPLVEADLPADLSSSDRMRLQAYIERGRTFRTLQIVVGGDAEAWKRRERLEREIVSAIEHEGVQKAAFTIAWQRNSPYGLTAAIDADAESTWAEGLVRDPADAVALPYLYAFLASRYRMQFERASDDRPALERLAKKYKTLLERVRNAGDSLFVLLADDLDNRPALTPGATRHPRQYLPDT